MVARDRNRAEEAASGISSARAFTSWRLVTESKFVDAIVVATPPETQVQIVLSALEEGKAVFAEKPMAVTLAEAQDMTNRAFSCGRPNMVDFNFTEVNAWKRARQILMERQIGEVRHVTVHWQVESYVNRLKVSNWKSSSAEGGGTLFNFVSHCLHYLEWLLGPISGLSSRLSRMPYDQRTADTTVAMALAFPSGTAGALSVSTAAYLGSGHRVEFYGEEGALILENATLDYMKGFRVLLARKPDACLKPVAVNDRDAAPYLDGRTLPASRLAHRFLDWVESGVPSSPDFRDGLRVQKLLDAALRSHESGRWIEPVI